MRIKVLMVYFVPLEERSCGMIHSTSSLFLCWAASSFA